MKGEMGGRFCRKGSRNMVRMVGVSMAVGYGPM
jgi:hypothetical protein